MRARFLKFFSFLFLTPLFLTSCNITVNGGSQNEIDVIESEVYDPSSWDGASSLTVENDTGCLVFQTPSNPENTSLSYTLTINIDGTDYTRTLQAEQIIVIKNLSLGMHKVTCKAFTEEGNLYAIGSSNAIFRSGETATLDLILERLPDASELVSISASYTGSYQKVNVIPSIESFNIVETYNDENTATGYKDNYEVLSPSVTNYMQKVGSIPITIRRKNTEIQDTVNVPFKYEPRESYNNPDISNTNISIVQNSSPAPTISISARSPTEYTIYGTSTKVKDDVSYQWLKNGSEITGATNSSYTVPTDTAGTFKYKCRVTYTPNATYATRTSPVYAISDEITVTVTSAATDAYANWSDLKSDIEAYTNTSEEKIFKVSNMTASSYISITGNVKIQPVDGGATITRSSSFQSNFFSVEGTGAKLTLDGNSNSSLLTLNGGYIKENDTGPKARNPIISVSSGAELVIENNVSLEKNYNSSNSGGAVSVENSRLTMNGGNIEDNFMTSTSNGNGGGGISLTNSTLILNGGNIKNNTAKNNGGGIYAKGSSTSITITGYVQIIGNVSEVSVTDGKGGGGIYLAAGTLSIGSGVSITQNSTGSRGGGIYNANTENGKLIITEGSVTSNTAYNSSGYGNNIYGKYRIGETGTEQDTLD